MVRSSLALTGEQILTGSFADEAVPLNQRMARRHPDMSALDEVHVSPEGVSHIRLELTNAYHLDPSRQRLYRKASSDEPSRADDSL